MATEWEVLTKVSNDVLQTAQRLIGEYHPELADVRILFMFRSEPGTSNGKIIYGGAEKASAKTRALTNDADFIIWVSERDWANKTEAWREALIDHQLCHCGVDDSDTAEVKYYLRPHDIEEFHDVIQRHGAWTIDIARTDSAIENAKINQLTFNWERICETLENQLNKDVRREGGAYTVEVKHFKGA